MKRAFLLTLSLVMLLSAFPAGIWAKRLMAGNLFATEDTLRENAISDALERTEGGFSRFFSDLDVRGEGRYIVRFAETLTDEEIFACLEGTEYRLLSHSAQRVFVLSLEDEEAFLATMGDKVLYCCEDRVLSACSVETNDPLAKDLAEYQQMELYEAWPMAGSLSGITVAVLDTGVDRTHEDLAGTNLLNGYDAVAHSAGVSRDEDGHGTAVTGLIAATANNGLGTAGVAHGVAILPIRVAGDANRIYSSDLIGGIRFAADAGADILNLSLGGYTYSVAEFDAVQYALEKGCILIAAAGNHGNTAAGQQEMYPASYEGVISVGSCDAYGERSAFSQDNAFVDLLAPGEDLLLLGIGDEAYVTDDGTSYSAALVSGLAALALSALEPSFGVRLEGEELLSLLADGRTRKGSSGYGEVSALTALEGVNAPLITGVEQNQTYDRPVTVRFNRGEALLDGEPCTDGTTVYANGIHRLTVTENGVTTGVLFRINRIPATYEMIKDDTGVRFSYSGGMATVDGIPYVADSPIISPGWHRFALTDGFGEVKTEQFFVDLDPMRVQGVEDGGFYDHPVYVTVAGSGTVLLDGKPAEKEFLVASDGIHQLTLQNGNASRTITFTLATGAVSYQNDLSRSGVIVSQEHLWYAVYSEMLTGIRVYDLETGEMLRFVNTETVNGYVLENDRLLIFGEWKLTVLDPALMRAGEPLVSEFTLRCEGFAQYRDTTYCLSAGTLLSLDVRTGEMSSVLETDADELYASPDGLWLYDTEENRFDRVTEEGIASFTPAFSAGGKRKLFVGGMLICGGYGVRPGDFSVAYSVEGYALTARDGLLYTTEGVYDLYAGTRVGTYGQPVSGVTVTEEGTFVCFFQGGITYYPRREGQSACGYAPENSTPLDDPRETGVYDTLYTLYGSATPAMLSAYGDRMGGVFTAQRKFVLWLDGKKVEETDLPFAPTGVALHREHVCIWDGQTGLLWLDGLQYYGGMPIDKAFFAFDRLYVLSGETLFVMQNGVLTDTGIRGADAGGGNSLLAWIWDGVLYADDGKTVRSVSCSGETLFTDGNYIFAGKRLYTARTLQSFKRLDVRVYAMYGGMMLTDQGLIYAGNGSVLSAFEGDVFVAALGGTAGAAFCKNGFLTVSRYDYPVWELPVVDGIPTNGWVDRQTIITFDRGMAFLDGEAYTPGTPVRETGAHTLLLVLPCGMVRRYEFFVVPALDGITLNGPKRVAVGETGVLRVQYSPEGTSAVPVVYSVTGDCIRLNEDGSFVAVHEGTALISASTEDGRLTAFFRIWVESAILRFHEESGLTVQREDGILLGVPSGTHRNDVLEQIISSGNSSASTRILGTGTVITLSLEGTVLDTLTVAVEGDLDGDGYVTLQDLLVLEQCLEKGEPLTVAQRYAADLNGNGSVTDVDINLLRELLLYKNDAPNRELPSKGDTCEMGIFLPSHVMAGDTLAVTLYLQEGEFAAAGTTGVGGRLRYDEAVLEYLSADYYGWNVELYDEGTWLSFLAWGDSATGEMPVMTVYFNVKEPAEDIRLRLRNSIVLVGERAYGLTSQELHFGSAERVYGDICIQMDGLTEPFDPQKTQYDVYLPAGAAALDYLLTYPEGTNVTVENAVFRTEDTTHAVFTFRLPGGETKQYTITARRGQTPPVKIIDTTLLSLTAVEIDIPFDPAVFAYTLSVPYHVDKLTLSWVAADEEAEVSVSDTHLAAGEESVVTVTVRGKNGEETVYTLTVSRAKAPAGKTPAPATESQDKPWWIPVVILVLGSMVILGMMIFGKKNKKDK